MPRAAVCGGGDALRDWVPRVPNNFLKFLFKPVRRDCSRAQLPAGAAGTVHGPWPGAKCPRQPDHVARYVSGAALGPDHGPAVTGYVSNVRKHLNAQPARLSHSVVPWGTLTFVSGTIHALGKKNPAAAGLVFTLVGV